MKIIFDFYKICKFVKLPNSVEIVPISDRPFKDLFFISIRAKMPKFCWWKIFSLKKKEEIKLKKKKLKWNRGKKNTIE